MVLVVGCETSLSPFQRCSLSDATLTGDLVIRGTTVQISTARQNDRRRRIAGPVEKNCRIVVFAMPLPPLDDNDEDQRVVACASGRAGHRPISSPVYTPNGGAGAGHADRRELLVARVCGWHGGGQGREALRFEERHRGPKSEWKTLMGISSL
jgi:hypothetical protein